MGIGKGEEGRSISLPSARPLASTERFFVPLFLLSICESGPVLRVIEHDSDERSRRGTERMRAMTMIPEPGTEGGNQNGPRARTRTRRWGERWKGEGGPDSASGRSQGSGGFSLLTFVFSLSVTIFDTRNPLIVRRWRWRQD